MSKYMTYTPDQLEEHFSNFIIESWSFSKVANFARNEKDFEMRYIYREDYKSSVSAIAGIAYHDALKVYFEELHSGEIIDIVSAEKIAFEAVECWPADKWKLGKTTPTIEEAKASANKTAATLLKNFYEEDAYSEITEILYVEQMFKSWLTVNGVDIPLPCGLKVDLIVRAGEKVVIIDHKTKRSFSDEKEAKFTVGKQAITYVLGVERETGLKVDEVWFIENKYSKNRDKSSQFSIIKSEMDKDTRSLYESLLYEPLKRMIEAISDPNYVYLMNDNDSFVDKAQLYEFIAKTMISEVDAFNIPENKRDIVKKRLEKIRDASRIIDPKTIRNFREKASNFIQYDLSNKDMNRETKIEHKLKTLGLVAKVEEKIEGFSSDTFLISLSAGEKLANVFRYKLDIAHALGVSNIRIMRNLFVKDGTSYIALESSKKRDRDLIYDPSKLSDMKLPIGIDNFGDTVIWDLDNHSTPHALVCGATGSGKSVFIRSTVEYAKLAGITKIVLMDPKFEFTNIFRGDPVVSIHSSIEEIEFEMQMLVEDMNKRVKSGYVSKTMVIFDEFADAVAQARKGKQLYNYVDEIVGYKARGEAKMKHVHSSTDKSLEENLKILLQKGRSSGFRILSATQRASTKVITGDAKVNFPVLICFRVPKEIDSRVVLDEEGAETLMGFGDGLVKSPEYRDIIRFQGFFIN